MDANRIVLTGYEPWAHASENPTLELLERARGEKISGIELITLRVPVDSARITSIVEGALDEYRPTVWISLGLYPGLSVVGVERTAVNTKDFPVADNVGSQPFDEPIASDGPFAYQATIPVKAIVAGLTANWIPAKVSNTASTYLCNQIMYTALHLAREKNLGTRAGFIHVPCTPAYVAAASYPEHEFPSMSVDLMAEAIRLAVIISAKHEVDIKAPPRGY